MLSTGLDFMINIYYFITIFCTIKLSSKLFTDGICVHILSHSFTFTYHRYKKSINQP